MMNFIDQLLGSDRMLIAFIFGVLSGVTVISLLLSFLVLKNRRKLIAKDEEISKLREIRKTFIDADHSNVIYLKDENLNYIFANKAFTALHKKENKDIIGHNDYEVIDEQLARIGRKTDLDVLREKMTILDEVKWNNKIFLTTKFPVKLTSGNYGVGAYIRDVTEQHHNLLELEEANKALKENEKSLKALLDSMTEASYRDPLTGLYNRRFFEEELKRLDVERNLPISIIIGDVNGLKLTNDIFGHTAGDLLLQKAAEVMKKGCRSDDIIARWGGDEYGILLPRTKREVAEEITQRIKTLFANENIKAINCSISLGFDTKETPEDDLSLIIEKAEDQMYLRKTIERRKVSGTMIKTIIKALHDKFPGEEEHSINVSEMCGEIAAAMNLSESETRRLKDAGFYHDIGKIVLDEGTINKTGRLTDKEWQKIRMHSVVGYRILNSADETVELAKYVLSHHERWDGTGYPKGLKGEDIPRLSRIMALAESFDAMTNSFFYKNAVSREEALQEIEKNSGTQFDPEISRIFIQTIRSKV